MELIIICLWDVEKCSKNTTINLFWKTPPSIFFEGEIWDTLLPYFGLHLKSLFSEKNSRCSTPNNRILKGVQKTSSRIQFLLPQLPSCDIKTNENFTGFGFSERCWKLQLLNCIKHVQSKSVFLMASSLSQLPFWITG